MINMLTNVLSVDEMLWKNGGWNMEEQRFHFMIQGVMIPLTMFYVNYVRQQQGLYSLSGWTYYRKISWSLEAVKFEFRLFQSL